MFMIYTFMRNTGFSNTTILHMTNRWMDRWAVDRQTDRQTDRLEVSVYKSLFPLASGYQSLSVCMPLILVNSHVLGTIRALHYTKSLVTNIIHVTLAQ